MELRLVHDQLNVAETCLIMLVRSIIYCLNAAIDNHHVSQEVSGSQAWEYNKQVSIRLEVGRVLTRRDTRCRDAQARVRKHSLIAASCDTAKMPSLSQQLRRLSTGFQVKLPSRKSSGQTTSPPVVPLPADQPTSRREWTLSDEDYAHPPPAYSFVDRDDENVPGDAEDGPRSSYAGDDEPASPTIPALTPDTPRIDSRLISRIDSSVGNKVFQDVLKDIEASESASEDEESRDVALEHLLQLPNLAEPESEPYKPFTSTIFSPLPREVWLHIGAYLPHEDAAALAFTNRETAARLGPFFWPSLNHSSNMSAKAVFLAPMASDLPHHYFCAPCAQYHARHAPHDRRKREILRSIEAYNDKPILASHCRSKRITPSTRLTLDWHLPFPLAHLAMAGSHFPSTASPLPLSSLNRTWVPDTSAWADMPASWTVDTTWYHRTRFATSTPSSPSQPPHLLVKVTSTYHPRANLTASEQRLILSSRTDYTANYTTCAHESKGGLLFNACKCALGHIPISRSGQDVPRKADQCNRCRVMYKCMLCPTEYSVSLTLVSSGTKFQRALTVTRWTDLGPCDRQDDRFWNACSSEWEYQDEESVIWEWNRFGYGGGGGGKGKTVRGTFESANGEATTTFRTVPLRRPSHWRSQGRSEFGVDLER